MAAPIDKPTAEKMVEVKNRLVESLGLLNNIWDDIGLVGDQKNERTDLVFMYIKNLIDEMVTEEEKRRSNLRTNIDEYKNKLAGLCAELHVAPIQPTATRLFEIERELKQEVQCWENEKQKRLEDLKELTAIEQSLCDIMHATPMYIPSGVVPTREQIEKLRVHTDQLAKEKASRYEIFIQKKDLITTIMSDIGEEVTTEFEQDVVIEDSECFVLSEGNMAQLTDTLEKLEEKQRKRISDMKNIQDRIEDLWARLEMSDEERVAVDGQVTDHTPAALDILEKELARCEKLKYEHMQQFITKVREELQEWWDKCHYSKKQRASFSPYSCDDFSEELLTQHENALEAVKQFYAENEQILKKIEKRTELWNQMVMFDAKENDPNRFRNRGGNLLAEEKAKKKVLIQLPKVEEQLKDEIDGWEQENNRQFLIGGVQFFEFCRLQWEEYKTSKELQKQQRLEQKEKEMQSEIRYGSKPTPSKRRFCTGNNATPSQTPKTRKLNDTTRSTSKLHSLSKIHSVFTSPAPPPNTRTPLRSAKTTSSLMRTPVSTTKTVPRTPMSAMGPPRTPMSTRSTARKINETGRAQSCMSLASPNLKNSTRSAVKSTTKMKKAQSERKLDRENTTPPSSSGCSSLDSIISQSSQVSDVEPLVANYEEFQNVLHSAKKNKQYRSTICPQK